MIDRPTHTRLVRLLLAGTCCVVLAACANGPTGGVSPSAVANASPDERGVITYATYQVAVARDGDTIATLAPRVGTTPGELSQRNGLPETYALRAGEVVVLPDSAPRLASGQTGNWSPDLAAAAIDGAPVTTSALGSTVPATGGSVANAAPPRDNPFQNGQTEPLIDPIRHRVEAGETVYSIARLYGVSATALASWNGLGPDLALRENQELLIPIVSGANQISSVVDTAPGQGTAVTAPPIAAEPLPENMAPGEAPESPGLSQFRTPPGGRLSPPVSGPVVKAYNPGGGANRSEGIGFGVPAGTSVKAAGDGEVALVSDSLGGLGTIVLVRHADDLMTVYGRVTDVNVARGQRISAGQSIGVVAPGDPAELHFEVRRGTDSVDPNPYIGG